MKDCTFTVEVNGKRVTYDYDGIRAFLMDSKNLAAVAPTFYGGQPASKSKPSAPKKLMQEEHVALTSLTDNELYGKISTPFPRSPLQEGVPKASMYETAAEARAALSAITAEYMEEGANLRQAMNKARERLLTVRRRRTEREQEQLEDDFLAAKGEASRVVEKYRNKAIRMIAPGGLADITWNPMKVKEDYVRTGIYTATIGVDVPGSLPAHITEKVQIAFDYFRLIVGDHPDLKGLQIGMRYFENQPNQRAFFKEGNNSPSYVELSGVDVVPEVVTHELGHWLESVSLQSRIRVGKFLKRRAGKELPKRLSQLTGDPRFEDHEIAVKDKFITPYIGKYYSRYSHAAASSWKLGTLPDWEVMYASEVISMGVQYMYENPARFAQEDPDMFDFIFDTLRPPPVAK